MGVIAMRQATVQAISKRLAQPTTITDSPSRFEHFARLYWLPPFRIACRGFESLHR